ncbi:serine/threonine protein kinase, putative [Plasmodium gallinaceum]|uniref:Serine/threonine protein kinase, putative n=1 Tax=Plasmodium gallinaceum TaxID=5849 RepID=A0A1J1GPJ8_PLAGA|nr:serine/threonine protein kinase, putative [Plasmodium gallinaceum]CRG94349.1 serine/threonine protein kinase, putative [Plasmodium gallinaceum]
MDNYEVSEDLKMITSYFDENNRYNNKNIDNLNNSNKIKKKKNINDKYFQSLKYTKCTNDTANKSNCNIISFEHITSNEELNINTCSNIKKKQILNYDFDSYNKLNTLEDLKYENEILKIDKEMNKTKSFENFIPNKKLCDTHQEKQKTNLISCYKYNNLINKNDCYINKKYNMNDTHCNEKYIVKYKFNSFILNNVGNKRYNLSVNNSFENIKKYNVESTEDMVFYKLNNENICNKSKVSVNENNNHYINTKNNFDKSGNRYIGDIKENKYEESEILDYFTQELYNKVKNNKNFISNENKQKLNLKINSKNTLNKNRDDDIQSYIEQKYNQHSKCFIKFPTNNSDSTNKNIIIRNVITKCNSKDINKYKDNCNNCKYEYNDLTNNIEHLATLKNKNTYKIIEKGKSNEIYDTKDKTYLKMINDHFKRERSLKCYNINESFLFKKNTYSGERDTLNISEKKYFQNEDILKTIINKKINSDPLLSSNRKSLMSEFLKKKNINSYTFNNYLRNNDDIKNKNKMTNRSQIIKKKLNYELNMCDKCFNKWKNIKKKKRKNKNKTSISYYKNVKILNNINKKLFFCYNPNVLNSSIYDIKTQLINNSKVKSRKSNSCFFLSAYSSGIFNILKTEDFHFTPLRRNRSLEYILSNGNSYYNKVFSLCNNKIKKYYEYYDNGNIYNFYRNKIFNNKRNESNWNKINNNNIEFHNKKCYQKYYNKFSLKTYHSKIFCEANCSSFMKSQFNKIRRKFLFKNIKRKKLKEKKQKKAHHINKKAIKIEENKKTICAKYDKNNDNKNISSNYNSNKCNANFQNNYYLINRINQKKYSLIMKKCLVGKKKSNTHKNKYASFSFKTKGRHIAQNDNLHFKYPIKKKEFLKNKKKMLKFLKLKNSDVDILNRKISLYDKKVDYKNNANVLNLMINNSYINTKNTEKLITIKNKKRNEFINSIRDIERKKGNSNSKNSLSHLFNYLNISSNNEIFLVPKGYMDENKNYEKMETILKSNVENINKQKYYYKNIYLENKIAHNKNIPKQTIKNGDTTMPYYLSHGTSVYDNDTKIDKMKDKVHYSDILRESIEESENKKDNKKKLFEMENDEIAERRKKIKNEKDEAKKYYNYEKKKKKRKDICEKETTLSEHKDINKKENIFDKFNEIYNKKKCTLFASNSVPYMKENSSNYRSIYYIVGLIYYGKKSQVYKCVNTIDKRMYAMKIVSKDPYDLYVNNLMKKYLFLKNNPHKNIITIHDIFSDKNYNCIIMELCKGSTLLDYFMSLVPGSLDVFEIKLIMKNLFLALDFLHSKNIIHRDIKFENIMFKKKRISVFDNESYDNCRLDDPSLFEINKSSYIEPREKMRKINFKEDCLLLIKNNILLDKKKRNRMYNNSIDIINYEEDSYTSLFYDQFENSNFKMDSNMEFSSKDETNRTISMNSTNSFHSEFSVGQYYTFKYSYSLSGISNNFSNALLDKNKSVNNTKKCSFTKLLTNEEKGRIFKKSKCKVKKKRGNTIINSFSDLCLIDMDMIENVSNTSDCTSKKSDFICGTAPYMPPESLDGVISTGNDIWACGVILYALMDGHFPFEINNNMPIHLKKKILTQTKPNFDPLVWQNHPEIFDLCLRLLDPNPLTRIQNAREALIHYCFSNLI